MGTANKKIHYIYWSSFWPHRDSIRHRVRHVDHSSYKSVTILPWWEKHFTLLCVTWHWFFHMAFIPHHTEVCTGVAEWEGDEPLSEEEEMERVAASLCKSSTFFWSSVRMARSSLRFWWIGTCQVKKGKAYFDSHSELSFPAMRLLLLSVTRNSTLVNFSTSIFRESVSLSHLKWNIAGNCPFLTTQLAGNPFKSGCKWFWWDTKYTSINVLAPFINTTVSWT